MAVTINWAGLMRSELLFVHCHYSKMFGYSHESATAINYTCLARLICLAAKPSFHVAMFSRHLCHCPCISISELAINNPQ